MEKIGRATIYNIDCMEFMKGCEDNQFDLAIVDPPYGIGMDKNPCGRLSKYGNVSQADNNPPKSEYFIELIRVSKNQIIWGGNYFDLPPTRCFLIWDKKQPEGVSFASCELAWTSFELSAKTFYMRPQGADIERIHPTQKPVKLYEWLLTNYAKQGNTILDTHMGSGSIAIATNKLGFDLTAMELDKDYYQAACKRIRETNCQVDCFTPVEETKPIEQLEVFE